MNQPFVSIYEQLNMRHEHVQTKKKKKSGYVEVAPRWRLEPRLMSKKILKNR
jgi:hypothetical protein